MALIEIPLPVRFGSVSQSERTFAKSKAAGSIGTALLADAAAAKHAKAATHKKAKFFASRNLE
ncbi:MAG: hypothetical protein ACYTE0_12000 [Planctomycetota bacterium]